MENVVRKGDLLEFIHKETGCIFLSDLHCAEWLPQIKQVVRRLDAAQFSTEQWIEAARYILCQDIHCVKASEVRQFLLDFEVK